MLKKEGCSLVLNLTGMLAPQVLDLCGNFIDAAGLLAVAPTLALQASGAVAPGFFFLAWD